MQLQPDNRAILLEALKTEEELDRFLNWLLSKNMQFEAYTPDVKRELLERYLKESYGPKPFRIGKD
jgi:hypothetical protein